MNDDEVRRRSPSPCPSPTLMDLGFGNENSADPGARVSEAIGTLMVHYLAVKHGFTKAALADVLKVVSLHLPPANVSSSYRSVHCLLQASSSRTHSPSIHTLCNDCGELVQQEGGQDDCLHSHAITFNTRKTAKSFVQRYVHTKCK